VVLFNDALGWVEYPDSSRLGMSDEDEGALSECPSCEEVTEHSIIKRTTQGEGEDVLVRCISCSLVHKIMIRPPKPVMVRTTLSDGRESFGVEIEVDEDEEISVGDMFEHDAITWKVTRIDNVQSRPEKILRASKIFSMWATRSDKTIVGITMTSGEISESGKLECEPDRVFSCGSIINFAESRWRIRAIHTGRGRTLTGSRVASEIRRIYLHPPDREY
jgi:uncharacterized Zn finger protein|tara:strand:- start:121 stop:777 length:657 start_codon:yes stop_codon:yes gene_type:complete